MPLFKGIQVSIASQCQLKSHPEYPHPDSSQFTHRDTRVRDSMASSSELDDSKVSGSPESKADKLLGREPIVSVYIPSISGARFWLRYSVIEAAAVQSPWYYFKLFMNGRHITSWGTNSKTNPHGQVMKGLFDPATRWNYKQDGIFMKNCGTELRHFFFNNESEDQSLADDGGLIEVRAYRARGRQRAMPKPEIYKPQDEYGILMPSGGLIDQPQDSKFYDYHLRDPIDKPFATFKFHYRSWENLVALQLIPVDHPEQLFQQSPTALSLYGITVELESRLDEVHGLPSMEGRNKFGGGNASNHGSTEPIDPTIDDPELSEGTPSPEPESLLSNNLPECPKSIFSVSSHGRPLPDPFHSRPLPEIPPRGPSLHMSRPISAVSGGHVRNHSAGSVLSAGAASITPSLFSYLEREHLNSPEPEIGVASVVPVRRSPSSTLTGAVVTDEDLAIMRDDSDEPQHSSEPDSSPPTHLPLTASSKKRRGMASPPLGSLFTLPNITIRKKRKSPLKSSPGQMSSPTNLNDSDIDATTISLSESEWMCRTPSPVRDDPEHARVERLWSPPPGQRASKDGRSLSGGLRKKAMNWYGNVRGSSSEASDSPNSSQASGRGLRVKSGNWI